MDWQPPWKVRQIREEPGEEYELHHFTAPHKCQPLQVPLKLDGELITMEIDTGASVSIMSETEHQRRWSNVSLNSTPAKLRTYTGETPKVLGSREVEVPYGQQRAHLQLVVVNGDRPCLLEQAWPQQLQLDWPNICLFWSASVQEVLAAHPQVFREELGTLQGYNATIHVESSACPKFCKARSILLCRPRLIRS